ncbi:MAG TPA: TetR/AcrR family transcriptional regulator [Pseudolabrys sp.]|nr:TetR/AcrR family transcriptional regulator [Pseudolabrys sp.]
MQRLQAKAAAEEKTIPRSIVGGKTRDADVRERGADKNGRSLSDAKRRAILRGAKGVFLREGFGGTSMDAVAARAGVSKMTVYRHFGSKEELFAGLITDLCNRIVAVDLERIFRQRPEEALRRYAERIIDIVFAPETVELHRIVVAESKRFPNLGRFFYTYGPQVCIDVLVRYFERNRDNPRFRVSDPLRASEEFLELLRGYGHLRVLLGIDRRLARREIAARIEAAVRHVLRDQSCVPGRLGT